MEQRRADREFDRFLQTYRNLEKAVKEDNVAAARAALESGISSNQLFTGYNIWAHQCVDNGQLAMLELLLEFGHRRPSLAAVLNSRQPWEVRENMARLLVKFGESAADPSAMDIAVRNLDVDLGGLLRDLGATYGARELAAFNRLDELKTVVNARPEIVSERVRRVYAGDDPTLLGLALAAGYREMSLFLIEAGAPLDTKERLGMTLLHLAARGGDPDLIRLLAARGLDVNARDHYGDTPLRDISSSGTREAITTLLELGADVNAQGVRKETPLYTAVASNRRDIVDLLLAAGADPTIPALTKREGTVNEWREESTFDLARKQQPQLLKILETGFVKRD